MYSLCYFRLQRSTAAMTLVDSAGEYGSSWKYQHINHHRESKEASKERQHQAIISAVM